MRILTGLQPTARVHIGNYFGAMRPAIEWQERGEAFYFIANFHALTTLQDAAALRQNVRDLACDFLAMGLDPKKAAFYRQSDVPEVAELAWYLSCVTPMSLLEKCHSYKDKIARGLPASHGLFAYPALMAADILLFDVDLVPVGKDQKQHVEVTRDIAIKMNETFGAGLLKLPEALISSETAIIPGLDGQKMSKSYGNTIELFEEESALKKKVMRIPTDSTPLEEPKPMDKSIILPLYKIVASEADYAEMVRLHENGGTGYGDLKKRLLGALVDFLAPVRQRRAELAVDPAYVEQILVDGAARARAVALPILARVREAVGIPSPFPRS